MSIFIPIRAWPLNTFQLHGTMCCEKMLTEYEKHPFASFKFSYQARTFYEANVFLLWGSISLKLADTIKTYLMDFKRTRFIVHIRGCQKRLDTTFSSSSLTNILPINLTFSTCTLSSDDLHKLIVEARQCLRA